MPEGNGALCGCRGEVSGRKPRGDHRMHREGTAVKGWSAAGMLSWKTLGANGKTLQEFIENNRIFSVFYIEPCEVRATARPACSCLAGRMERSDWGGRETERGRYPMERFGSGRLRLRAKDKKSVNRKTNECYSFVDIACLSYCMNGDIIDKK